MNKTYLKIAVLAVLAIVIFRETDNPIWEHLSDKNWIAAYVGAHGVNGVVWLLITGVLFTGCGGPRQLIAFLFGYTFGAGIGLGYAILCTLFSAAAIYWLARLMFKQTLSRYFPVQLYRFERFVKQDAVSKVLLLRIFPIGSNLLTNLCSGMASVPFPAFLLASLFGYLPQTIIFSLAGSGIGTGSHAQLGVSLLLGIISILLTGHLYRKHRLVQRRQL